MKKSLVLAMAMALGVTASAYAANPFSDVPAGHWAYDSISKLAAAGVIEGYGDTTFGGDKLMTRYEMAQIVAKAMAKGANCDKLAAEFADELDNLGVRVANLEKKADNVKITGQIRYAYKAVDQGHDQSRFRTRLFLNGQINEDWSYTARFHQENDINSNNTYNDNASLNWAFVTGKVGGVKVTAGRTDYTWADTIDTRGDGLKLSYGKDIKLTGVAMKAVSATEVGGRKAKDKDDASKVQESFSDDRFYVADLEGKIGVVNANARYFKSDATFDKFNKEIIEIAAALPVAKDLKLAVSYFNGDCDDAKAKDDNGYIVGLTYKGAKAATVGTWGLYAKYSDRPYSTYMNPTVFAGAYAAYPDDAVGYTSDGYKGYEVGANYTVAKNMVLGLKYTDFEGREGADCDNQTLWSEIVFTF